MLFVKNLNDQKLSRKQEDLAQRIAEKIIKLQLSIAGWLNVKTANFSKVQKEIFLLVISAFFGAISLYLIFHSIQ
ncbi:hypothetical protein [Pedobacter sp. SYSU D00535]|uniref:hypothetical protein n=1 Tax=Pedobacter sp. SYSU D00535 TaxID=2810308 RepID=UPI001A96CCFC|nr:hypothetical protein [Pedobacter sp. SYSU D00535]